MREQIANLCSKGNRDCNYVCSNCKELTQIISLERAKTEKVENPYHLKDTEGNYYNQYPEFAIFEDARQAILKALEEPPFEVREDIGERPGQMETEEEKC